MKKLWHFMDPQGAAEWMVVEASDKRSAWAKFLRHSGKTRKQASEEGFEVQRVEVRR